MSVESEYRTRYRLFKLGNFGHNFEKVIMNLAKGTVNDLSKLSSLTYFMLVAKKMYVEMGLGEEADKLTKLSDEWDHWVQVSKEIERKKNSFDFYSFLSIIDVKLSSSFMYMKIDNEDYKIRSMAVSDKDMYKEYIINLLDLKQRELLYEILGIIWLNIHTNKQLSLTEIRQIVERSKIPEAEKLPEDADTTLVVDDAIDAEKVNFTPNAPDSTPLGFKKALRIIMPVIDIFKDNFYKDTELKTRCNNAEVYAFSVLITASKIMYTDENVVKLLKQAYQICKNVHNYYLVRVLSKWKTMNSFLIDHFESKYEITLSSLILEMFEKAENLIESIQRSTGESFAAGDIEEIEEGKRRILNYKRTKKELDPKHFVGWIIKHDDLTTITEILRSGEPIVTYDVEADPYHLKFSDLSSINLILGQTGAGKSIWSINLERSGINDGYCIWDCSLNIERSTEMLWCCMPLLEKYYKKTYRILTQRQGMHPEGLPMTILFPYYGEYSLPKKLPAEGKVITIPLYMLAKKHYALSLLFSSYPNDTVLNVVDFILQSEANETWDLDTLRHRLTQLAGLPKDEEAAIWINEQVADFKYRKKYVLDKAALRKALTLLLPKSDLISSGISKTAINFKELCISGSLVVPYLGGMPSKSDCMAFVLWIFNAIVEFASKSENKGRKIGILINEAQTVVPSQQLVGGALSEEKYGMSVEFASSALQWRGLALKVIINTQMQGQLREQIKDQAGIKMMFHTNSDKDLDFAFGQVQNPQLKENLKTIVVNKFYKDEHILTVITGPETENIKIVASAVPPCSYEIPNLDFFEVYEKEYPTRVIDTRLYLNQIADDKRRTFMNTIKDEIGKSIEILDEGKTLTAIDERETTIMKDTLNAILEETQKQGVPDGHTAVPNVELAKMHKMKKGELIVDPTKTYVVSIRTDHYIDLVTKATKNQGTSETFENTNNKVNASLTLFNSMFHIIVGCNSFDFILTRSPKNSSKKPKDYFIFNEEILPKLGFNMSFVSYYNQWNDVNKKTDFFRTTLESIKKDRHHILRTKKIELKNFLDALDPKVLDIIYKRCAEEYYPLLKDILPWKAEVKTLAEKNSTNS